MRKAKRIVVLVVVFAYMGLFSCSIIGPAINSANWNASKSDEPPKGTVNGKEPVTPDADPPADYAPTFLGQTPPSTMTPRSAGLQAQLSRIEINDPNYLNIYLHFVDQDGRYVSGGTAAAMKEYWCDVEESFDSTPSVIDDFTVRE